MIEYEILKGLDEKWDKLIAIESVKEIVLVVCTNETPYKEIVYKKYIDYDERTTFLNLKNDVIFHHLIGEKNLTILNLVEIIIYD